MKKSIALSLVTIEKLKALKYHTFLKKAWVLSTICSKCENEDEKIFKEDSIEILKIIDLIKSI